MRHADRNMVWVVVSAAGEVQVFAEAPHRVQVFVGCPETAHEAPVARYRNQAALNAMMWQAQGFPQYAAEERARLRG